MDTTEWAHDLIALAARMREGYELTGAELAQQLQNIVALEVSEGGPYALPDTHVRDLGLNLAIVEFLRAYGAHLPNLDAFLDTALATLPLTSSVLSASELGRSERAFTSSTNAIGKAASGPDAAVDESAKLILTRIRSVMAKRFAQLSFSMKTRATNLVERTLARDHAKQIPLMAHYVRQALGSRGASLSDQAIAQLGFANICSWASCVVYDDFWDEDEAADPQLLPVANLFARHYIDHFSTLLPEGSGLRAFFHETMDSLDAANLWETVECRMRIEGGLVFLPDQIPDYGDCDIKFYPASGHIMGPVAMLLQLGFTLEGPEVVALIEYFKHYLIAMQMNDDAHDWKEDLSRGHISTVVAQLLTAWKEKYPESQSINLELEEDMAELEQIFWYEVLVPHCTAVISHTDRARAALQSLTLLEDSSLLERFVVRNEHIAQEGLREHARSAEFVRHFINT